MLNIPANNKYRHRHINCKFPSFVNLIQYMSYNLKEIAHYTYTFWKKEICGLVRAFFLICLNFNLAHLELAFIVFKFIACVYKLESLLSLYNCH